MNTWTKQKLLDLVDCVIDNRGKNPPATYDSGIPIIDNFQITGKRSVNLKETKRYIDENIFQNFIRKYTNQGDLLVTLVGNGYGNVALSPKEKSVIIQNTIGLRCNNLCLNNFLFYYFSSNKWRITNLDRGAAQPSVKVGDLLNIEISIPPVNVQTQITQILSNYDDLIENNEKRIKILEEMAQRLYTEWFVKYKFPGYEKVKMVDSGADYGKIPEGWEVANLGEVAKIVRGCSYSTEEIDDRKGDYYIVNLKSFNRGGGFRFDGDKYFSGSINSNQSLKTGDVVVAVTDMTTDRAVIARPARIPEIEGKITFSADVVKINSEILPNSFIYQLLSSYRFTETTKQMANGANVLHLKPSAILEFHTVIPDTQSLNSFNTLCEPIAREIDKLLKQNDNLSRIRDLLIPQLVTGKRELKN